MCYIKQKIKIKRVTCLLLLCITHKNATKTIYIMIPEFVALSTYKTTTEPHLLNIKTKQSSDSTKRKQFLARFKYCAENYDFPLGMLY